ncbi:hypothetical protein ACF0H5_015236 [Mactra antiquata]
MAKLFLTVAICLFFTLCTVTYADTSDEVVTMQMAALCQRLTGRLQTMCYIQLLNRLGYSTGINTDYMPSFADMFSFS